MMFVGAIAELATIGSVIPFLALLSRQAGASHLPWPASMFGSPDPSLAPGAIIVTAVAFAAIAVAAGLIRLELAWLTQDFVYRVGHELALGAQRRILSQPYAFHVDRHSSTLISATDKVEVFVFDLLLPLIQMATAGFIASFLLVGLLYISPLATVIAGAAFVTIYALVSAATAKRLLKNSTVVGTAYHERLKIEQESLGGIRDVIIDHSQAMHLDLFDRVNSRLARARATTNFMAQAPRFIVESVGMIVVVAIAVMLSARPGGIASALPFLGALALGAQRLLPLVQTIYTGWSLATAQRSIVGQVIELLRLPLEETDPDNAPALLPLKDRIRFDEVTFAYVARPHVLAVQQLSFDVPCGSMIALIGETGSGKTTLADLLMGLISPTSGRILVDGEPLTSVNARSWHQSIAHVPQTAFLMDSTIARNIALSLPDAPPDHDRIVECAKKAQLHDFIQSLPAGYETSIGERGVRLSGGQRQRLGLARAIYKGAPVMVLDEATSALDDVTEAAVIASLDALRGEGRTIVIVAHRLSTIRHCDLVARLDHGRLVQFGPFDEILSPRERLP